MSFLRKSSIPIPLRDSEFADALPKAELRQLDRASTRIDVAEGRRIITEATPGRECFVIVDGKFEVTGPAVATTVGAGNVVGELALLTGRQRNASVVATTDSTIYVMHHREFATLLSEAPQFCRQVVSSANKRLGSEPVTLPAQFVRKEHGPSSQRPRSDLTKLPSWSKLS